MLLIAEFSIPGGMAPHRAKQKNLAKRVGDHLDLKSRTDPSEVVSGGKIPIDTIHRNRFVHRAVWIFALDSQLRQLLAWRAPEMRTCAMTWSAIGEDAITKKTYIESVTRELTGEARVIALRREFQVEGPFLYHYVYKNGNADERIDNNRKQAFVILPRDDAIHFRMWDSGDAEAEKAVHEYSGHQGNNFTRSSKPCGAIANLYLQE